MPLVAGLRLAHALIEEGASPGALLQVAQLDEARALGVTVGDLQQVGDLVDERSAVPV